MFQPFLYPLLLVSILFPCPLCGQSVPPDHHRGHHRSHLDTDPDMDLNPVRPIFRSTTRGSTMRDWFHLPTIPPGSQLISDDHDHGHTDYDYLDYDDYTHHQVFWPGDESSGASSTESQPTSVVTEEEEYVEPFDGHGDHFKNGSSEIIGEWLLTSLSLMLAMAAALL